MLLPGIEDPQAIFEIVGRASQIPAEKQKFQAAYELARPHTAAATGQRHAATSAIASAWRPRTGHLDHAGADRDTSRDIGNDRWLERRLAINKDDLP